MSPTLFILIASLFMMTSCREIPKESAMQNRDEMSEIAKQMKRQATQAEQRYYKAEAEYNAAVENGSIEDRTNALKLKKEAEMEWEEIRNSVEQPK